MTIVAALIAQAGPAWSADKSKLPRCDGAKRRDANPYGSVLPGATKPAVTAPPVAGKPVAALSGRMIDQSRARSRVFPSC